MKKIYQTPAVEVIAMLPQTSVLLLGSGEGPEPKPGIRKGSNVPVSSIPG